MADWYVSSASYSGYTLFQISHAYSIGDLIRPISPTLNAKYVFRCTTAGTSAGSEPTWTTTNNSTTTSGTAVFTNVTGQSSFFWTAAAGTTVSLSGRVVAGDRVFYASDHTETQIALTNFGVASGAFTTLQYLSVNRAGSTPPVVADLTPGATLIVDNAQLGIASTCDSYLYGMNLQTTTSSNIGLGNTQQPQTIYLENCALWLNNSSATATINGSAGQATLTVILDNTTVQFGNVAQQISGRGAQSGGTNLIWINTPSPLVGATIPTVLFTSGNGGQMMLTARGVDFSAITTTLVTNALSYMSYYLFDSCKIASGVTRYITTGVLNTRDVVELVNCYDGTNIINEIYTPNGTLTTEFTITLSSGAADNVGAFSHKMVSNANIDKFVYPFCGFWLDVENTSTGSSKTATVEIISSASLNNDDIALYLQYEGTSSSSVASFVDSFIATPLTAAAAVTSSSATWNSSPATPQAQKLQVTFTPQHAGRIRGQVRLGKASTTVYVNPQIVVT